MKKICILFALILIPWMANAQLPKWKCNPKYNWEIHAGYNTSKKINGYKTYTAKAVLGTLQGVRLNEYLDAYVGVDAQMFTHYYKGQDLRWALAPYLNFRGYYPMKGDFSPFLNLSLGADVMLHPKGNGAVFYCEFGPGFRYKKFNFNCGLVSDGKKTSRIYAKIGFEF